MGLFRPLNENIHNTVDSNAFKKANGFPNGRYASGSNGKEVKSAVRKELANQDQRTTHTFKNNGNSVQKFNSNTGGKITPAMVQGYKNEKNNLYASGHRTTKLSPKHESATASLLGISDEEFYELNEGNCDSDTCKCKGGTCPVSVTDGISTSSYAAKKLANAGSSNQTDLNAVKPNAEYNQQNDAKFIGDGDSPETSKTNIPAILAAKTAGGAPHGWTTDNGINGTGSNVFKLRKLRDDDGPNG